MLVSMASWTSSCCARVASGEMMVLALSGFKVVGPDELEGEMSFWLCMGEASGEEKGET